MHGWLYIIKNGDLYKIGITKNIDRRIKELKPDYVVAKIYSSYFKELEKEFHKKFKSVRIPQTEYFRLNNMQIREIKQRIKNLYYPRSTSFNIFIKSIFFLLILFLFVFLIISLNINDMNAVLFNSLLLMEKISFCVSFLSLFIKSKKYLNLYNELKFRVSRFLVLMLCAFFFRFVYNVLFCIYNISSILPHIFA